MQHTTNYTFPKLLSIIGGEAYGQPDPDLVVRYLLTDSRQLIAGAHSMFFAIATRKNNGHHYVSELLKKGVRIFVVSQMDQQWVSDFPDAGFIVVSDSELANYGMSDPVRTDPATIALQRLAAYHRSLFQYPVIGITGSNGKTIIKEWLFQLLGAIYHVVRNPKSYNSQLGVPLSVWQMSAENNLAIFEAGISRPGEMERLADVIKPDIGIFSNIGPAHDAGFAGREEKIREKLRLFAGVKVLIYCADHADIDKEVDTFWGASRQTGLPHIVRWGRNPDADIRVVDINSTANQTTIHIRYRDIDLQFDIPFADQASVENILHCAALMLVLEAEPDLIRAQMPKLQAVAMRLELKEGINQCTIINDSYNNDLNSLAIAIDFLNSQTRYDRTTLILSDILQTGLKPGNLYRQVADLVKAKKLGRIIGIGPNISSQFAMFAQPAMFYPDTDTFLQAFDFSLFDREAILLKGARPFAFEKLSQRLQQKDHQTVLEVDLDALLHNLNVFKALLKPGVRTMAMVKAFSYGSGSVEIAGLLQYHHVDYLAVAYADEGKELRQGGVTLPIVVMNPEVQNVETLQAYKLEPEIYSLEQLEGYIRVTGETSSGIHIKIDSGMHRLGFLPSQLDDLISVLRENPWLRVASVFSHLAASDNPSHDDFSRTQVAVFQACCQQLESGLGYAFMKHICNSAAVSRFAEAQFDMVRLGIGLYGISNDPAIQQLLQHVSTFKSVVSQVKSVKQGDTVGYERKGVAGTDIEIAIVPIGYADGLRRQMGNGRGSLFVRGALRPIIGNISMDMCAIDVTGMHAQVGDEVVIFGKERPVSDLASEMDTIPYEVLTSVSHRVKRVYFQGG